MRVLNPSPVRALHIRFTTTGTTIHKQESLPCLVFLAPMDSRPRSGHASSPAVTEAGLSSRFVSILSFSFPPAARLPGQHHLPYTESTFDAISLKWRGRDLSRSGERWVVLGDDDFGRGAIFSRLTISKFGGDVAERRLEVMRDDDFGWMRGDGLGDVPAKAEWCNEDLTGFLIELRSRCGTEQLGSKRTHRRSATPVMLLGGRSGWASGGTEVHLGIILATPPATDVTSADDDEMGLDSSLDADVACRAQFLTRRNGPIVLHSPTRLDFHDILPFDQQRGRAQRPMGTVRAQWPVNSGDYRVRVLGPGDVTSIRSTGDLAWITAFDCAAAASCNTVTPYLATLPPVFKGVFILLISRASGYTPRVGDPP
ncbi:hypothetical protein B0H13DRAFT_2658909 [Mycena leptocephala]|nr:hypothetical protein B0H13DRAFT_2658909 [Mycena leptocephala]